MPITERVSLFGYSAFEVEKLIEKLNSDFEKSKDDLEQNLETLKQEIDEIKEQIEYYKQNRPVTVKKRVVGGNRSESRAEKEIMQRLYEAHIGATEKLMKIQANVAKMLEQKKSTILIRERKVAEMKDDLNKLIEYVGDMAKDYK